MVRAYHAIFTTYGFWLPNDPRGSWSDFVRSWELFKHGKEVEDVGDLWLQGPSHVEPKPAYEDLLALKGARMSRIDKIHYVFYGFREAVGTLSLLCVRNYPDGIQRFVKLSEASITAENYPGIEFATDSRWKMPQPWPGSTDVPEDRR